MNAAQVKKAIETKWPEWEVKGLPNEQTKNRWRALIAFAPSGPLALVEFSVSPSVEK